MKAHETIIQFNSTGKYCATLVLKRFRHKQDNIETWECVELCDDQASLWAGIEPRVQVKVLNSEYCYRVC